MALLERSNRTIRDTTVGYRRLLDRIIIANMQSIYLITGANRGLPYASNSSSSVLTS
jgi:hypothetical protein